MKVKLDHRSFSTFRFFQSRWQLDTGAGKEKNGKNSFCVKATDHQSSLQEQGNNDFTRTIAFINRKKTKKLLEWD
jgi:hypothetical protein